MLEFFNLIMVSGVYDMFVYFQMVMSKFKKHQAQAVEEFDKKKKQNEEADRKKKEKAAKAKEEESKMNQQKQPSKITELTDEEAAQLQKEIDAEVSVSLK